MNSNEQPPIDVQSTAVTIREEQPQQGVQRFDVRTAQIAIESVINRAAVVGEVMQKVMKEGVHFGTIPGTNDKKVLLKAGAEKLSAVFNLIPQFVITQTDYPNYHREYRITCRLSNGTEGVGTCSTLEEKYRYRKASKKCPQCGKETIIEGKAEYGGGWLCWAKKGGCGTKFELSDPKIASQAAGKVEHSNPADYWNTCLKMSKKRAHVDAIITATSTSDLLTQDVEEMQEMADQASAAVDGTKKPEPEKKPATQRKKATEKTVAPTESKLPENEAKRLFSYLDKCKAAFIDRLAQDPVALPFAWAWAVNCALIMPNEKLDAVNATKLFPTVNLNANVEANKSLIAEDFRKNSIAIETLGKAGPLAKEQLEAYNAAYRIKTDTKDKPVEVPRDPEASWKSLPIPSWSKHVKEMGHKTFGDLPKNLLWWWAIQWQPTGYNGQPPKPEEVELRKTLDFVKDNYDFESKEDRGSEPASREPAPPVEDDQVPF